MCNGTCKFFAEKRKPNESNYSENIVSCLGCKIFFSKNACRITKSGRLLCSCCNSPVRFKSRAKSNKILVRI